MSINLSATQAMVDSHIKEGVDGIIVIVIVIVIGSVGENCFHTREEKKVILISGVAETTHNLQLNTHKCVKKLVLMV